MPSELRRSVPDTCLSDLAFDELHAGELGVTSAQRAEEHVAACARCRDRRQALLAAQRDFLEQYPTAPNLARRPAPRKGPRTYAVLVASLALAAAAVALVVRPRHEPEGARAALETRSKGGARLSFHVKRSDRIFEGADRERVKAGDQLRFSVANAPERHVAVFSRDGSGAATVYYPSEPTSRALGPASETALDAAVELDATVGEETLVGVFCDSEFALEPLRAALEHTGRVPTMPGCTIDELRIFKDPP
jgi:hypothetical protein